MRLVRCECRRRFVKLEEREIKALVQIRQGGGAIRGKAGAIASAVCAVQAGRMGRMAREGMGGVDEERETCAECGSLAC